MLDALAESGPSSVDEIAAAARLTGAELGATLARLELDGRIARLVGGRYQRVASPEGFQAARGDR